MPSISLKEEQRAPAIPSCPVRRHLSVVFREGMWFLLQEYVAMAWKNWVLSSPKLTHLHYYRNVNLSRLGNPCCPDFPTGNARPGQKGGPFVPGLATGTKGYFLSRLVTPTGTKGAASATWLAHPFVPVGITNRDKRSIFFSSFFLNCFSISIILLHFN